MASRIPATTCTSSPSTLLAPPPSAKVKSVTFTASTIMKTASLNRGKIEQWLKTNIHSANTKYVTWVKNQDNYTLTIQPFPAPITRYAVMGACDNSNAFLRDLLNIKAPTRQTSEGALIWDLTLVEAYNLTKSDCKKFPESTELLYPQFLYDPESFILDVGDSISFDIRSIFARATCFQCSERNGGLCLYITIPRDWKTLAPSDPSRHIFEQLLQYKNENLEGDEKGWYCELNSQELKEFATKYYQYARQQTPFLFDLQLKPVTCQLCKDGFSQIAKEQNLEPLRFTLYQDRLEIPLQQHTWDKLLASMPSLASVSPDQKNWIIPEENIRLFFQHAKVGQTDDLLASFFKSIDLLKSLQGVQISYGSRNVTIFFSSDTPNFSVIEKANGAKIGQELSSISRLKGYRKGIQIPKEQMPRFMELFQFPQAVQSFVNSKIASI